MLDKSDASTSLGPLFRWLRILLFLFGLLSIFEAHSIEIEHVSININQESGPQAVDEAAWILEDRNGNLDFGKIRSVPIERWKKPASLPINQGFSDSTWWIKLKLKNSRVDQNLKRIFEVASPLQDYIDIFVLRGDGASSSYIGLGDRVPFKGRPIKSLNPSISLDVDAGETVSVYIRSASHDGLQEQLPLILWMQSDFEQAANHHWLFSGMYYGLMLTLLIYTIYILIGSGEPIFAFYTAYIFSCFLWRITFSGDAFYLLWPESPIFNNQILPIAMGCCFFFGTIYVCIYINLKQEAKRIYGSALVLSAISLAAVLPSLFGRYALCFMLGLPLGLLQCVYVNAYNIVLLRKGRRQSIWAMIAFVPLILSAFAYCLQALSIFPPNIWISKSLELAIVAQLLLIGLGLSDALDQAQKSKTRSELEARAIQEDRARGLEEEVVKRMSELARANEKLRLLSITDGLTGVWNRRHFNEVIENEINQLRVSGRAPSLCLFDIDFFKSYNDAYGHQRGDFVLAEVAGKLREKLQESEKIFRVGGEEFALLFSTADLNEILSRIEFFRKTILELKLQHDGNPSGIVTASFGLALHSPSGTLGEAIVTAAALYREADRLLYEAKAAGRNRVKYSFKSANAWPSTDFGTIQS